MAALEGETPEHFSAPNVSSAREHSLLHSALSQVSLWGRKSRDTLSTWSGDGGWGWEDEGRRDRDKVSEEQMG